MSLDEFHKVCQEASVSYTISFWKASGELEVEIHSPAAEECFYKKRVYDLAHFVQQWQESTTKQINELGDI